MQWTLKLYIPWDNYLKISNNLANKLVQIKNNSNDKFGNDKNNNNNLNQISDLYNETSKVMKNIFFSKENKFNISIIFIQCFIFNFNIILFLLKIWDI